MTPHPIQAVLDTAAARMLFASLAYPAGASTQTIIEVREGALAWLAELAPRDRAQSALAVRVIASHHAMMHHLAQAAQGDLSDDLMLRHRGRAITAARMMDRALEALEGRQMMAPLRAVALPGRIAVAMAEGMPVVMEAEAGTDAAVVEPGVVAEAGETMADADAPVATPEAAAPEVPEAPAGSMGYVARRLQELEEKLAREQDLTAAQRAWRLRHMAAGTETLDVAMAA